jgi:predicted transcriptional regulator
MDFKKAAKLGALIAKDYAEDIFRLLVNYRSISASEAASRLNLHIRTVQDFLEAMAELDFLSKEEVYEHKRPYYRYSLKKSKIGLEIDLESSFERMDDSVRMGKKIRERKNARVLFTFTRDHQSISTVVIWIGKGRSREERKINLTAAQGDFLFHLPFPSAPYLSIRKIMEKAGLDKMVWPEIADLVELLETFQVIEEAK